MDYKECDGASKAQYLLVQKYFDKAVQHWDDDEPHGNTYRLAHFDGVTALARDSGVLSPVECEFWRQQLRWATCVDRGHKPFETAANVAAKWGAL